MDNAYGSWLDEVARLVHLTPEQVEKRAGDEPMSFFEIEETPLGYASLFLDDAIGWFGETEPESEDYATVEGIQRLIDGLPEGP